VGGIKNLVQSGTKKGIKVETGTQGFVVIGQEQTDYSNGICRWKKYGW
jgi:hypothetical protein